MAFGFIFSVMFRGFFVSVVTGLAGGEGGELVLVRFSKSKSSYKPVAECALVRGRTC